MSLKSHNSIDTEDGRIHSLAATLYYALQLNRDGEQGPIFQALPSVHQGFFETLIRLALKAAEHWTVPTVSTFDSPIVTTGLRPTHGILGLV